MIMMVNTKEKEDDNANEKQTVERNDHNEDMKADINMLKADGPYYHQERQGMKQTTPIISGGIKALRHPVFSFSP